MERKQNSSANNEQRFRDYRLALYQEELGTVDLEFKDERNASDETHRIDVLGFERDFTASCEPGSELGYVLLLLLSGVRVSSRSPPGTLPHSSHCRSPSLHHSSTSVLPVFTLPINPEGASLSYIGYALHTNPRASEVLSRAFGRVYQRICICATRNADD
jgi:hypothetical protein